jgi:hypothetical protein
MDALHWLLNRPGCLRTSWRPGWRYGGTLALAAVDKLSDDEDRYAGPEQPCRRRRAEPGAEDEHQEQQHSPPGQPWAA